MQASGVGTTVNLNRKRRRRTVVLLLVCLAPLVLRPTTPTSPPLTLTTMTRTLAAIGTSSIIIGQWRSVPLRCRTNPSSTRCQWTNYSNLPSSTGTTPRLWNLTSLPHTPGIKSLLQLNTQKPRMMDLRSCILPGSKDFL